MISESLIDLTLSHHRDFIKPYIVRPSIPILYFGDLSGYLKSQKKIITVALNPSDMEFKKQKEDESYSFCRFPRWDIEDTNLIETLNSYFDEKPYDWFDKSFEPLLRGMKASYYTDDIYPYRALHTDICSPLATNPKWTDLNKNYPRNEIKLLREKGLKIWKELINELQPDIILVSVKREYFQEVFGLINPIEDKFWSSKEEAIKGGYEDLTATDKKRENPYIVYRKYYQLNSGKISNVFWGKGNQYPFMDLDYSTNRKPRVKLGEYISRKT